MQKRDVGNPLEALRRAGYFPFRDPKSGEESFVCRLGADFYPRFHLYLAERGDVLTFSLHLDQKHASYGGSHLHNGEYEGEHIEQEMERIRGWIAHVQESASQERTTPARNAPNLEQPRPALHAPHDTSQKRWWQFWK